MRFLKLNYSTFAEVSHTLICRFVTIFIILFCHKLHGKLVPSYSNDLSNYGTIHVKFNILRFVLSSRSKRALEICINTCC